MTFTVEVVLKDQEHVVDTQVTIAGEDPPAWTEIEVESVLCAMLRAVALAKDPEAAVDHVGFRGVSWVVHPIDGGVMIGIEIPSGAVAAGPFGIAGDRLEELVGRVIAGGRPSSAVH